MIEHHTSVLKLKRPNRRHPEIWQATCTCGWLSQEATTASLTARLSTDHDRDTLEGLL